MASNLRRLLTPLRETSGPRSGLGPWLHDSLPPSIYSVPRCLSSSGPQQPKEAFGDSPAPPPPPRTEEKEETGANREEEGTSEGDGDDGVYVNKLTGEVGGPRGPEPTRYGDWERAGRCSDF
ncbi:Succinate dehydrogenase assembly factor 4, mitochondrial [Cocos nucifera]|uniref:Succinate dehydrogenase assembly factor 4, mitochondrial n=1 Tax=Cocos nucifera TaxID=13894 RepID=A0A8K0HYQ0_COCNU|nr:Succinate dehydrogenase assembly factor 4, mitochondrial [Cocos nucifera]